MIYYPEELVYGEDDKVVLRASITNFLKGSSLDTLRKLAAESGVNSPTSKSKEDIMNAIIDVILREVAPGRRTMRGAPTKIRDFDRSAITSLYDGIKGLLYGHFEKKNIEAAKKSPRERVMFTVGQAHGEEALYGYFAPERSGGSIRRSLFFFNPSTDVALDEQQVLLFPFKAGDLIEGISELTPTGARRLKRVVSVNGKAVDEEFKYFKRFENVAPCFPDKPLTLNEDNLTFSLINALCPVLLGQRVIIESPFGVDTLEMLVQLSTINENTSAVIIGKGADEEAYCSEKIKNCAVCPIDGDRAVCASKIALAMERAKRLAEDGKDAIVVIDDLNALLFLYASLCDEEGPRPHKGGMCSAMSEALKLFNSARSLSTGGSVTVIAFMIDAHGPGGPGNLELLRLAQCRLLLSPFNRVGKMPLVDFARSYSRGSEGLISPKAQAALEALRSGKATEKALLPVSENETAEQIINRISR